MSATVAGLMVVLSDNPATAQDATWSTAPVSGEVIDGSNWIGGSPPVIYAGTAYFGASSITALTTSSFAYWNGLTLNADAANYMLSVDYKMTIGGAGVAIHGGSLSFVNTTYLYFGDSASAGTSSILGTGATEFVANSTAGNARITNNGRLFFSDNATGGNADITNNNLVRFRDNASAGNAAITNATAGVIDFSYSAGLAGDGKHSLGSLAGAGQVYLGARELTVGGNDRDTTFSGTISDCGTGADCLAGIAADPSTGGALVKTGIGILTLTGANTYTGGTTFAGGTVSVSSDANLGDLAGALTFNGGILRVTGTTFNSTARAFNWGANGGGFDISDAATTFELTQDITGSGGLIKRGAGTLMLSGSSNSYTGLTDVQAGTLQLGATGLLSMDSRHNIAAGATLDLNGSLGAIASLTGAGTVTTSTGDARLITAMDNTTATFAGTIKDGALGKVELWVGGFGSTGTAIFTGANTYSGGTIICDCATLQLGNGGATGSIIGDVDNSGTLIFNRSNSYTFAGVISDSLGTGKLIHAGTGNTILTGLNTYTGQTIVNAGTLSVNGSIASSSLTTVNAGGTLGGTGTVGNVMVNGGTLAPGNSIGTLTVQGNLAFTSAARYLVEVSPAGADRTNITGIATLGGATVNASFAPGSHVAKQYTILNATGGLGGSTFGSVVNTNLPENFKISLSYDGNNAYLDLALAFIAPPSSGLSGNQQGVGNALVNYFNSHGGIPLVYGGLTASGLTQASGETATGSQQTGFNAMTQFMGMMMDPFAAGRGDAPPAASGFAAADAMAYAPAKNTSPRDAYAAITKAMPHAPVFEERWSVWASGFGGSQSTDGNAAIGSNASTSRIYGAAAGADVWLSPTTLAGISMAGGATTFSVTQGGSGQSDLVQIGGFVRHSIGSSYVSAAAAYGWQDVTTDRSVTVAGLDRLRARFNANSFGGRIEFGSRFVEPWSNGMGLTPYAAVQVTAIDLPSYAESVVAGSSAFALSYSGKTVTSPRVELGLRSDKSFALDGALLTLRGRAGWAHDTNPERSAQATFQALPGASFVVNGAAAARNSALTTASAEVTWLNGLSLAATFEGEFSETTRSYAGKGVVRYAW